MPLQQIKSITDFNEKIRVIEEWTKCFWKNKDVDKMQIDYSRDPYYMLPCFPYPSAQSLHIGHSVGYIGADVSARFMRMTGKNVLQCFGFDALGLPGELGAILTGEHPEKITQRNIENMIKQVKDLGLMIDWDRKIITSDPNYYKWTQWIFQKFYEHFFDDAEIWKDNFGNTIKGRAKHISVLKQKLKSGDWSIDINQLPQPIKTSQSYTEEQINTAVDNVRLAYIADAPVNWCPKLGTVLSDEEVVNGRSERGNFPVIVTKQKQWMLRITKYAERLTEGFEQLNWPESTINMQKHWIGISEGMEIDFTTSKGVITVYTTRPDTILGATFIAASSSKYPNLKGFTGDYATHPITKKLIPIWVAEYVLEDYGTGYVMGVPAHDIRDFKFANEHSLPIIPVIKPTEDWLKAQNMTFNDYLKAPFKNEIYTGKGPIITPQGVIDYNDFLVPGRKKRTLKLRDWIFSRQRYWGEPFPLAHCPKTGKIYLFDESELPICLPHMTDFTSTEVEKVTTPLERCKEWINTKVDVINNKIKLSNTTNAKEMLMDANTMPNWAGSCWYYLRYLDPKCGNAIFSEEEYSYWTKNKGISKYAVVDTYIAGGEHAVLHYLYSRFWHKFLFDINVVENPEPYQTLIHQGLISAPSYFNPVKFQYVAPKDVELRGDTYYDKTNNEIVEVHKGKMGKSYKNGIECGEVTAKVGASVLRLYVMYMGPLTDPKDNWDDHAMIGMSRFLRHTYNATVVALDIKDSNLDKTHLYLLIKEVTEAYKKHTQAHIVIAKLIEFLNKNQLNKDEMIIFMKLLAPIAPHFAEYLYQQLAPGKSIFDTEWPTYKPIKQTKVPLLISFNGKFKKNISEVSINLSNKEIASLAGNLSTNFIIKRMDKQIIINFLIHNSRNY